MILLTVFTSLASAEFPILCVSWKQDGASLFSSGCGKAGYLWTMGGGGLVKQQVASHDAPVKFIKHVPALSPDAVVTGSWVGGSCVESSAKNE
jgi:mRNA export factor